MIELVLAMSFIVVITAYNCYTGLINEMKISRLEREMQNMNDEFKGGS